MLIGEDFLGKLFAVLKIPKADQEQFRKDLGEIISFNLATAFLEELPSEKKPSFIELIRQKQANKKAIEEWARNQQITPDPNFWRKINSVLEKSIQDFFVALTKNLDTRKRKEVLEFASTYLK